MCPKDADGMANSVDPDQTAPLGAVWSGSSLFAHNQFVWKLRNITVISTTILSLPLIQVGHLSVTGESMGS